MFVLSPTFLCVPCTCHQSQAYQHTSNTHMHTRNKIITEKCPEEKTIYFCMHVFLIKIVILGLFFYVVEGVFWIVMP